MNVVLDTNVLIEGFKDEYSYEKQIIDEINSGKLQAYANHGTMRENRLLLKQLITNSDYLQQMDTFFSQLSIVKNIPAIDVVKDPEDNKILASAVSAEAEYLITNDDDLLRLGSYQNVKILKPGAFWREYTDAGQNLWNEWATFINNQK